METKIIKTINISKKIRLKKSTSENATYKKVSIKLNQANKFN